MILHKIIKFIFTSTPKKGADKALPKPRKGNINDITASDIILRSNHELRKRKND